MEKIKMITQMKLLSNPNVISDGSFESNRLSGLNSNITNTVKQMWVLHDTLRDICLKMLGLLEGTQNYNKHKTAYNLIQKCGHLFVREETEYNCLIDELPALIEIAEQMARESVNDTATMVRLISQLDTTISQVETVLQEGGEQKKKFDQEKHWYDDIVKYLKVGAIVVVAGVALFGILKIIPTAMAAKRALQNK